MPTPVAARSRGLWTAGGGSGRSLDSRWGLEPGLGQQVGARGRGLGQQVGARAGVFGQQVGLGAGVFGQQVGARPGSLDSRWGLGPGSLDSRWGLGAGAFGQQVGAQGRGLWTAGGGRVPVVSAAVACR